MRKGSFKGVFLLCFKVVVLRMMDQQSPYSPNGAVSSLNSVGKKIKTSKQGLEKGMIHEHDNLSDLLQHLAEFQANYMQLSHFESKSVAFLRLYIFLLDMSSDPPCTHLFKQEGWDKLSSVTGFHLPWWVRWPTRLCRTATCLFFPCFGFQRDLCFGFGHLKIYIERSYYEDFWSKPNYVFWETTDLSNISAVGDPERKVILALEIWELFWTEQWGILLNGQISALSVRFLRDLKMSCVDCLGFLLLRI